MGFFSTNDTSSSAIPHDSDLENIGTDPHDVVEGESQGDLAPFEIRYPETAAMIAKTVDEFCHPEDVPEVGHFGVISEFGTELHYPEVVPKLTDDLSIADKINLRQRGRYSALETAFRSLDTELVRLLVKYGANMEDILSEDVLLHLVQKNRPALVEMAIDLGADVNKLSEEVSLIYWATTVNAIEVAALLIRAGCDVNLSNATESCLHRAISDGHSFEWLELLIRAGSDPFATDDEGATAFDRAVRNINDRDTRLRVIQLMLGEDPSPPVIPTFPSSQISSMTFSSSQIPQIPPAPLRSRSPVRSRSPISPRSSMSPISPRSSMSPVRSRISHPGYQDEESYKLPVSDFKSLVPIVAPNGSTVHIEARRAIPLPKCV